MLTRAVLWLRAYAPYDDARVAASNVIALAVAANGPLYPLYVWLLVGAAFWPSLRTLRWTPFFLLVLAVTQRSALAGCRGDPVSAALHYHSRDDDTAPESCLAAPARLPAKRDLP